MHTNIHTYIHAYFHTHIHTYIHAHKHTNIHTCILVHIHTYIHTYILASYIAIIKSICSQFQPDREHSSCVQTPNTIMCHPLGTVGWPHSSHAVIKALKDRKILNNSHFLLDQGRMSVFHYSVQCTYFTHYAFTFATLSIQSGHFWGGGILVSKSTVNVKRQSNFFMIFWNHFTQIQWHMTHIIRHDNIKIPISDMFHFIPQLNYSTICRKARLCCNSVVSFIDVYIT